MRARERWLTTPRTGRWPYGPDLPEVVDLDGQRYHRAWGFPRPGGLAHYREDAPRDALHLVVYRDGSYWITHTDDVNPTYGGYLAHAVRDTPVGTVVVLAASAGAAVLVGWIASRLAQ